MDSGRAISLLADTLRIFRLTSNPMESGRDSKTLDETSSSTSFFSPAIESGITCFNRMETSKIILYANNNQSHNLFSNNQQKWSTTDSFNPSYFIHASVSKNDEKNAFISLGSNLDKWHLLIHNQLIQFAVFSVLYFTFYTSYFTSK